jgi:hypothetical protein
MSKSLSHKRRTKSAITSQDRNSNCSLRGINPNKFGTVSTASKGGNFMAKIILILAFITGLSTMALAREREVDDSVLQRAISNIKSNVTISGALITVGMGAVKIGFTAAGIGALLGELKLIGDVTEYALIQGGTNMMRYVGLPLIIGGVIYAIFEPRPAGVATLTQHFITPEGLPQYLSLSEDQMLSYARMDDNLARLVLELSGAVDSVQGRAIDSAQEH